MKIEFKCQCGRSFSTEAKHAGRKAKCPACGSTLTIPEETPVELHPVESAALDDLSLEVNIGSVKSMSGKLDFSLCVHSSGDGHVRLYAYDPSDMRKSGVMLFLDESGFTELQGVLSKLENTIQELRSSHRMNDRMFVRLQ